MPADWDALLLTYLHDPPGKALGIKEHEDRARPLAQVAFGEEVSREVLHRYTRTEDILTATLERVVPFPSPGRDGERGAGVEGGQLHVVHPLSGQARFPPVSALQADR